MQPTLALELSLGAYAMIVVIAGGILWLIVYAFREQRRPNEIVVDPDAHAASNLRVFEVAISDGDGDGDSTRWIRVHAASEADAMKQVERFGDTAIEARLASDQA